MAPPSQRVALLGPPVAKVVTVMLLYRTGKAFDKNPCSWWPEVALHWVPAFLELETVPQTPCVSELAWGDPTIALAVLQAIPTAEKSSGRKNCIEQPFPALAKPGIPG